MEKTAKITRTVFKTEWTKKNSEGKPEGKPIYYHDIELENGDKGSIGAIEKEPAKLNPGQSLTYTIADGKIKAVQAQGNGFFKKQPANNASFAMAYAKDVVIGSWSEHSPKKLTSEELFKIADKMFTWMEEKK